MEATSGTGRATRECFPRLGACVNRLRGLAWVFGELRAPFRVGSIPRCAVMSRPHPRQSGPPGSSSALARVGGWLYGWSGVWVSLLLCAQFAQRGVRPALEERERLDELAPRVEHRYGEARYAFEELEAEAIAWQDPVYRERRRRIQAFGVTYAELAPEFERPPSEGFAPNLHPAPSPPDSPWDRASRPWRGGAWRA